MKRILYIIIPIALLIFLYIKNKKHAIQGNFTRVIQSPDLIIANDTLEPKGDIDGITVSDKQLWLNQKFFLTKFNNNSENQFTIRAAITSRDNPIINFYVEGDTAYYHQGNTKEINLVNIKDNVKKKLLFKFNADYLLKLSGSAYLFQESRPKSISVQSHYINFDNKIEKIDTNVFSRQFGSSMKYSGLYVKNSESNANFFISYYDDHINCFNAKGDFKYRFKTRDQQNQKLDIIKEGERYLLNPSARLLRLGAFESDSTLFISSYVQASNQSYDDFKKNTTLDAYSNVNGKYLYSIYIPDCLNVKATDFALSADGFLYALYNNKIVKYDFKKYYHK